MKKLYLWKWELSAPIMGGLLTLAFAPYDYAYTAIPALMFLYKGWSVKSVKGSMLMGYLFGLGLFASGIWWVYVSIHDFGGADTFSALLLTCMLVGFWAIFPAIAAVLSVRITRCSLVWFRVCATALLWIFVEYFRGYWFLNGFPWLQIAYSQLSTPLAGFAPLTGVYGTGFCLAVSAFAMVELLSGKLAVKSAGLVLLILWAGGAYLKTVEWTYAAGRSLSITLVQGNVNQDEKWLPEQRQNTLRLYQQLTEQHWNDTQVIIWPETAIPAFLSQVQEFYLEPLAKRARQHHVDLIVSLPSDGEQNQYFNSVLALGMTPGMYHKNHLLPFGEYLPLQPLSGWVLDQLQIPLGNFTSGDNIQTLLTAGGYPFVTTICYEDAFGEQVNRQISQAAYIVNLTNDAWFGDTAEPYQHMQIAQMRALETGRYLVRATNTGLTGFVAPDGRIQKQAPMFTTATLTDTIVPMAGLTPYSRVGDNVIFLGLSVLVLGLYSASRFFKRKQC